jgi:3-(3-hydroxy-phenyl)propionate hydroxylase
LSVATCYDGSPLNGPDGFSADECPATRPGAAALDAPLVDGWLLEALGSGFVAVGFCRDEAAAHAFQRASGALQPALPLKRLLVTDASACARYGAERLPAYYLFRPDQHVAARWRAFDAAGAGRALARASGWAAPNA